MSSTSNKFHRGAKQRLLTPARRAQNRESQARYRQRQKHLAEKEAKTDIQAYGEIIDTSAHPYCYDDLPSITSPDFHPPVIANSENKLSGALFDSLQAKFEGERVLTTYPLDDSDQSYMTRLDATTNVSCAGNSNGQRLEDSTSFTPDSYPSPSESQQPLLLSFDSHLGGSTPTAPHLQVYSYTTNSQNKDKHTNDLPSVPFLFNNHIRLHDMTFLTAIFAIAGSINVTPDDYLNDRQSPFFLLSSATSIESAKLYFDLKVKPHLQPSLTQLSRPHASYLDLIIFPQFRECATQLATSNPCILDQQQLISDMLAGGLTCWGNVEQDVAGRGCGVPWDMRSWEAKPWFLKKWWFLLAANDEIHETSRWWRGMRGEYEDDSVGNSIL